MKSYINEAKRLQELAGIVTEANAEQAAAEGLEAFLGNLKSAANTIKPSEENTPTNEILGSIYAAIVGAPGIISLLGQGVDAITAYLTAGGVQKTSIGTALQKAGPLLEKRYIKTIALLLQKAYPGTYDGEDPFDITTNLHDATYTIYSGLLTGVAIGAGLTATSAANIVTKGLEVGSVGSKLAQVAQLAKKITAV
jgi:hypothetical protein